jgi:D-cysteine desulfhydrase
MTIYPARLNLAQLPTPIQPLDRLTQKIRSKSRIWIKRDDLTGCATSGNKIRKLEFTLADALQQDAKVIITCGGVQSNHARATAILGAQLGLKVHLLLRGEPAELTRNGNHFLDLLSGAEISCYPSAVYVSAFQQLVDDLCKHYLKQGLKPYFITTGASDGTGVWGYVHACEEIKQQSSEMNIHFDHTICAVGSGGTLAGLTIGEKIHQLNSVVSGFNVCDTAEHFEKKARADLWEWKQKYYTEQDVDALEIRVIDGYVGPGYAKAERPVYETIKELAALEGIILDPTYTGKAFYGMLSEQQKGRFDHADNILFIHTGGLFGLMADTQINNYI